MTESQDSQDATTVDQDNAPPSRQASLLTLIVGGALALGSISLFVYESLRAPSIQKLFQEQGATLPAASQLAFGMAWIWLPLTFILFVFLIGLIVAASLNRGAIRALALLAILFLGGCPGMIMVLGLEVPRARLERAAAEGRNDFDDGEPHDDTKGEFPEPDSPEVLGNG
jgi:hypothetical protein